MLSILYLLLGFPFLIKGADWLVDGASSVARRFGIPDLAIGLTVVAFGTSAPELIVSLLSAIRGNTEIAIGNVVGSNIANILLILGICALIRPLSVKRDTVWKEIPMSLLAVGIMGVMAADSFIDGAVYDQLSRIDGLVLLSFFIIFMYYTLGLAKRGHEEPVQKTHDQKLFTSIGLIVLGLGLLVLGGKLVVDGAVDLATALGVSSSLIGLTIVAVGTSLPELATSAIAARKGNVDIAIGNVVGSNIFNVFWILGISSIIAPLPTPDRGLVDIGVAAAASGALFLSVFWGKRNVLERPQGVLFLMGYAAYIAYLILRG
ncbi:MAG: Na+/Ca+ antiporter, CaCA family [Candidatus Uhrbacteria bacterium GW2011_GWD2_52_7]|uniref:Na+/Ca+ antiporter, CaCA family n=1 Tax=Candidatus Uhrbacteria bacterium GW2011_GWD2_52_7 TaxID=1618989 RepID=A0A0G1XBZ8_9BACT|nr:MAG: Na+/Ca+ antiporter, CaCA family [Candidatus Uhrbacteria bacterium GW2011_GWD2_52_7]